MFAQIAFRRPSARFAKRSSAFTILEVIVVLIIIFLFMILLLGAVLQHRRKISPQLLTPEVMPTSEPESSAPRATPPPSVAPAAPALPGGVPPPPSTPIPLPAPQ